MIYLMLAILASVSMNLLMKVSENNKSDRNVVTMFTYASGVVTCIALLGTGAIKEIKTLDNPIIIMAFLQGLFFYICFIMIQYSINKNGAPMTVTFNRMGLIVPTLISAILFTEIPTILQFFGMIISLGSIVYINRGNKEFDTDEVKQTSNEKSFIALISVLVLGGGCDTVGKIFSVYDSGRGRDLPFIFLVLIFCFLMSSIVAFVRKAKFSKKSILIGILIGIPNQFTVYFILKAVGQLPAYLTYTVFSGGVIILINVINYLIFKDKLTKRELIGTGIICLGVILISYN